MRLLMLGNNNCSEEMLDYAKSQGIYTIATDFLMPETSRTKLKADEYWMVDTSDIDTLEQKCRKHSIDAVICGISEFNQDMVIELTKRLNLPCYCTEEAWSYSRDKDKLKKLCREIGISVPEEYFLSEDPSEEELADLKYPVVVKPVDMCSNRGVSFCNNSKEVTEAVHFIRSISANTKILVEKKLQGKEFMALYVLAEGKAALLNVYVSYHQSEEPAFCYSVNTTAHQNFDQYIEEIDEKAKELMGKMGCTDGICWLELILNEDKHFYVLEAGYRLPGDMIFLPLKKVYGFDSVKWMVDFACGKKHSAKKLPEIYEKKHKNHAVSYMMWTNRSGQIAEVAGLEKIEKLPCKLVAKSAEIGDKIEAYRPLYTIVFDSEDEDKICELIEEINENVHVKNTEGEDMLIYFTDFSILKNRNK